MKEETPREEFIRILYEHPELFSEALRLVREMVEQNKKEQEANT